jgi:3-deoxy-D-manno-octulosonate 8-phosphate phosphatase (KDO 8-P phosphatase)
MTLTDQDAMDPSVRERALRVKLLLMDVDGVLTDGGLYYGAGGEMMKRFNVKDGHGLVMWRIMGGRSGILTARRSDAVEARARELRLELVLQGQKDKRAGFEEACRISGLNPRELCYVGDETNDLGPLEAAGLAVCPSDAVPEVRAASHLITRAAGGQGAIREVVEVLLRAQDRWEEVLGLMRSGGPYPRP